MGRHRLHTCRALDFARLDSSIFKYTLPSQYIGQAALLQVPELQHLRRSSAGSLDLHCLHLYSVGCWLWKWTERRTDYAFHAQCSASTGYNLVTWTVNPTQDNIKNYSVYRAPGLGASFGSASLLGSTTGNTYTDNTAAASTAYTYFIVANNLIGSSVNSTGSSISSSPPSTSGVIRLYGELDGKPTASQILFDIEMIGDESFLAAFSGSLGSCTSRTNGVGYPVDPQERHRCG
jgi:hypothetical protein